MSKVVLIYGGAGALGQTVVSTFLKINWKVISIDFRANNQADNILIKEQSVQEQYDHVSSQLQQMLNGHKLQSIVCVAGGWVGGNMSDASALIANSELMWKQILNSSLLASLFAAKFLGDGGLLVLTGAKAALQGTGGMIAYGMAKAAVHQLTTSLGQSESGMPPNSKVVCVLPVTLDTPVNRKFMPKADFGSWTPTQDLADKFLSWSQSIHEGPATGSLVKVTTTNGVTQYE